jgi:hypothetical protein
VILSLISGSGQAIQFSRVRYLHDDSSTAASVVTPNAFFLSLLVLLTNLSAGSAGAVTSRRTVSELLPV